MQAIDSSSSCMNTCRRFTINHLLVDDFEANTLLRRLMYTWMRSLEDDFRADREVPRYFACGIS
jgi:hypothetical protein